MLGESIKIQKDKTKLSVTTELPMSKRYTSAMMIVLFSLLFVQLSLLAVVLLSKDCALHRYLKYLTKKYLKKHNVRDWLRVIASNKDRR